MRRHLGRMSLGHPTEMPIGMTMLNKVILSKLLRHFAGERRRVVSDWRILIACRQIAAAANEPLTDEKKAIAIRREMQSRGDLTPVDGVGLSGVFVVDAPYASLLEVSEEQIVQEANPWAVFSHLTALVHHGLTDLIPSQVYATRFRDGSDTRIPLGTSPEDWAGLSYPTQRTPGKVRGVKISWTETKGEYRFGIMVGYSLGTPIYVTDVERTLIDALRAPAHAGGIAKVFHAWRRAELANLDRLVDYVDRFDNQTLRQRVGFMLQSLGHHHPHTEQWRSHLLRGGSVRLAADRDYSDVFSAEWNLSLNVPDSVLSILGGE
jgi:predicted transcriptional regulator of viral defense system